MRRPGLSSFELEYACICIGSWARHALTEVGGGSERPCGLAPPSHPFSLADQIADRKLEDKIFICSKFVYHFCSRKCSCKALKIPLESLKIHLESSKMRVQIWTPIWNCKNSGAGDLLGPHFGPLFGPRKAAKSLFLGFLGGSVFGPFPILVDFWALFGPKMDHFRAKNDPPKRPILTPFFDPFFGTFFGTKKGVKKWGLFWPFFGSKNQWLFARFLMTVFCVHFYRFLIEKSMNFSYFDQKILFRRRNAREDDGKKSSGPIFIKMRYKKRN